MTDHVARPLAVSAGLSVFAALLAIVFIANSPGQLIALLIAVVGVGILALGLEAWHRGYRLVAILPLLVGVAGVLVGLGWVIVGTRGNTPKLELLPGILGLAVLVVGLAAAPRRFERVLMNAGTALLLLGVFLSGLVAGASPVALLAATGATIVAWDCGEQAINLGEHVGRQARSWPVEVAHGGGAALVAGVGVVVTSVVFGAGISGLPLVGLTTLLGSLVVLGTALYM